MLCNAYSRSYLSRLAREKKRFLVGSKQVNDYDLSDNENAIKDGCFPSGPDAAYDLGLVRKRGEL